MSLKEACKTDAVLNDHVTNESRKLKTVQN